VRAVRTAIVILLAILTGAAIIVGSAVIGARAGQQGTPAPAPGPAVTTPR
jgi:hypothetical protein